MVASRAAGEDRNALASVHGKRAVLPEYGGVPVRGWSQTSSSSRAIAFSAGEAGTRKFWGCLRSAQSAPTTLATSGE